MRAGSELRVLIAAAAVLALCAPAAASAAEPLKIREAFPGSAGTDPKAEYVELQMTADGQADVEGQELRFYDDEGVLTSTYALSEEDAEGLLAETQRTVLVATADAAALGGDAASPDATLASLDRMSPSGGAVCFTASGGSGPTDCLAWGSFEAGGEPLPDPQSAPAAPIPDGEALHRGIAPGCPTYLDAPDDSGSSAADFEAQAPSPRANATEPTELRCPPQAIVVSAPPSPSSSPEATLSFAWLGDEQGVQLQCHLDYDPAKLPGGAEVDEPEEGEWQACGEGGPPHTEEYAGLADGFHRFWVRAKGENPEWGPAATAAWQVDTTPPETSVDSTPPDPSDGFAASFAYSSSEPFSSFRCQLDDGAIQVCGSAASSGTRTYFDLSDGAHVFRVWATDNAGNKDPTPATHSFDVQTTLRDHTPPDTRILLSPPDPSTSPTAFFAYGSTEPGSTFQCSLDGEPFSSCPAEGKGYGPLPNGPHEFRVRAVDRAGNVDSVPASHSWRVAAAVPDTRITAAPGGAVRSRNGRSVAVRFAFRADRPVAGFRCRLDLSGPYRPCSSPHRFKARPGRHVFEVFAVDELGNEEGTPAFRIFRVRAPGQERSFFVQQGRLLSSLSAGIAPTRLPRSGLRPVSLRFGSTFEKLDGTDIPGLRSMTLKLARGGVLNDRGLPRCNRARLTQRSSALALAACRGALVGRGSVSTALRFPEGRRSRSSARLLVFNARGGLLLHVYTTDPIEGTFIVPVKVSRSKGRFGTVLQARFPRVAAGFGQVTGFQMTLKRTFRHRGKRRSYLLAGCPAPRGLNRVSFELARVTYRFRGAPAIRNSTINTCRAVGR